MALFNIIFDFFYFNVWSFDSGTALDDVGDYYNELLFGSSIGLVEYLSFISTIISMVVIVLLCCALIKKIYNICAHVIG